SDLTGKIETKVFSDITLSETDGTSGYTSNASMITRCTVNVTVSGIDYEYYEGGGKYYALAYVSIDQLSIYYSNNGEQISMNINMLKDNALKNIKSNRSDLALTNLYQAKTDIISFFEQYSLYMALNPENGDESFFRDITGLDNINMFKTLENDITRLLEEQEDPDCGSFREAIDKIAVILKKQNISGGNMIVPPCNYEQTTISSEFGRYAASQLESSLINKLGTSGSKTIFRSNYWEDGDFVHLKILAINENGEKLGQAAVSFPYSPDLFGYDLKPQNFEESMIALKEFADGALTDGGLNIEIWTNKGRDEDSPVYENGETLQLFMRVNQPAYLQITYHLATGQNVLLEQSFYIGMDRVNRAVKLPYDFEVQAPFGIEQLIVTAYSKETPRPDTIIEIIDGEEYEIFTSMKAVTEQTRGLKRKQENNTSDVRVGEDIINLTTLRN
ncbi:MAG: DUF4384 domain-containing protein, partial [Deltaproteobacteria bacterium]|nr:DUF4384 domain-containing protein [Deltaproteobacteria bacterium]